MSSNSEIYQSISIFLFTTIGTEHLIIFHKELSPQMLINLISFCCRDCTSRIFIYLFSFFPSFEIKLPLTTFTILEPQGVFALKEEKCSGRYLMIQVPFEIFSGVIFFFPLLTRQRGSQKTGTKAF